ncbi:MAG: tetratricopeptide repeat protein [Myxococcales bacterium]|nr:tetratricopeptide repeat protein [Myxococcales bacterium]
MDGTGVQVIEPRGQAARDLGEEVRRLFEQGRARLDEGAETEALELLRSAHAAAPDHARLRSWLGLTIARVEGDFETGRSLCESAVKQEFFNPDLYLNLARVYLRVGRRAEALRYLRRGRMIDPGHGPIAEALADLGHRRLPVVPFLPRRHLLNRALGTARNLMFGGLVGYRARHAASGATGAASPVDTASPTP